MMPLRDLEPARSTPWVTWGTMLVCFVLFVVQFVEPTEGARELVAEYALVPARVTSMLGAGGDWGAILSLFTSMFMHGGIAHLASNLWFLHIFGDNVEDAFGPWLFALFYVVSGLGASAAQIAIAPLSTVPMVGASGAIAGVLSAYLVLYPRARIVTLVPLVIFFTITEIPAFVLIAFWFGLQFLLGVQSLGLSSMGGVAYWAHIGGFATGLVLAVLLRSRQRRSTRRRSVRGEGMWPGGD